MALLTALAPGCAVPAKVGVAVGAMLMWLVRVNPFTYAVDALRQVVLQSLGLSAQAHQALVAAGLGIDWFGRALSTWEDVLLIVLFGFLMTVLGAWMFSQRD